MGPLDHLETQLERQIPVQLQTTLHKPWMTTNPSSVTIAAWLCTDIIARPAPLPPATAKSAGRYPCSAAGSVAVWPAA